MPCPYEPAHGPEDHVIRSTYHVLFLCQTCGNSDIFQWRARAEEELPRHFGSGYDVKRTVFYIYYEAEAEIMVLFLNCDVLVIQ
ncbi:unnamed protein product [Heligmosomoides polygyrus]|uniref:Phage protein n=1 Tax=Heligmosomoides polygyrus TaxID=6339 RepID=A0A183G3U5_HELPZ|nr:unnamed protein product [Heligmosomoides polygyrus]